MVASNYPLWLKVIYTAFLGALLVAYGNHYGPSNFLWFSDVALVLVLISLWWDKPIFASMAALSVIVLDLGWNVDFFVRLATGRKFLGFAEYMFDTGRPAYIRGLSLFHVPFPILLIYMLRKSGYDPRALKWQTILCWVLLPTTWLLTRPEDNINYVYGIGTVQTIMPPLLYLALLMALFPMILYFPTHLMFLRIFRKAA